MYPLEVSTEMISLTLSTTKNSLLDEYARFRDDKVKSENKLTLIPEQYSYVALIAD